GRPRPSPPEEEREKFRAPFRFMVPVHVRKQMEAFHEPYRGFRRFWSAPALRRFRYAHWGPKAAQNRRTPRRWRGNEYAKRVQGPNACADARMSALSMNRGFVAALFRDAATSRFMVPMHVGSNLEAFHEPAPEEASSPRPPTLSSRGGEGEVSGAFQVHGPRACAEADGGFP